MIIDAIRAELIRDEGLRLSPYKDTVGKVTIGIGRNLDDVGISIDEAYLMLDNDIQRTSASLDRNLAWWKTLDGVRQRVILNMAFQLGIGGLMKFQNTLAAIKSNDYILASANMLDSKWAKQCPERARRLSEMMKNG